ncbi:uncharacterized protein LOC125662308 [Ostrea edulis]|uniref:uncharacterized protein LOC125662308 n=1 Tax=Ostrea edulis TaxID=37623 RepID=UPI0024AF7E09|nr:uncharacterized protein LOC125662308 [Ostrea edulis]
MALSIQFWTNYTAEKPKLMRKSENAVLSNHVLKFLYDPETKMVHSVVQASMKNRSYKVTAILGDSYEVTSTSCECPLGNYACHHVASALLYGVWEKHFCFKINYFEKFSALKWILEPEPCEPGPPVPVIEDLLTSPEFVHSDAPMVWLRCTLILSEDAIKSAVLATKGQRNNPMWSVVRKYRITASNFGAVLSSKRRRITLSLKKRLMSAYNLESIRAVDWSITHEDDALKKYEKDFGAVVEQSGIWLYESGVLGASPDGLIVRPPPPTCSVHYQTPEAKDAIPDIVEVKCPFSASSIMVAEATQHLKNFFLDVKGDSLCSKTSHPYYHQIQGQLHMCNKTCCDLIVWTTVDCVVIRIVRDSEWTVNVANLVDFYFNPFSTGTF